MSCKYCEDQSGKGFIVCEYCGSLEPVLSAWRAQKDLEEILSIHPDDEKYDDYFKRL